MPDIPTSIKRLKGKLVAPLGWTSGKTFGVQQFPTYGESLSADESGVERFKTELFVLLDKEEIIGDQIYDCDETGFNYKLLLSKNLTPKKKHLGTKELLFYLAVLQPVITS